MADLVSPIVDIISRLWTYCARHKRYLCKLQQNMTLLRNAMKELKDAKNDVERRVIAEEADPNESNKRTYSVSGWLQSVEEIEGEVEVILKKAGEQLSRARCLGVCCPPNNCWSNYKVGRSIVKKIPLVDELKGKGHFEEVTYRSPQPGVEDINLESSIQDMNLESTVGMEIMFDEVWSLINSTDIDKPVSIIGLYGQGGVGKTTLLEKINNEFNKIKHDHVVIFVLVSKPINYEAIQQKIGERMGLSKYLQGDGDEKSRAQKIFNALRKRNYVLLLDDIWEEVDKKRIGIPMHPQGNSKLIFTTRSERVCGDMGAKKFKVECLPKDKALILFQEKVGEEALNSFPCARELAKAVVEKCDGLPLALITIGRAMSTNKSVQEWKDAIITLRRYASKFQDMREKVLPSLKLSYDYLHNETEKSCFRYCAIFPEDYSININKLIDYWIAEGFLDGFDNLGAARSRGHTIIGNLKGACLLESSDEHKHAKTHVKMHDVIRDLALWIVNDFSSSKSTNQSENNSDNKFFVAINDPCKKWENAKRIFWDATPYTTRSSGNEEENPPTSPNLITLIVQKTVIDYGYYLPQSFFQHMPLLRVLDLSCTRFFYDDKEFLMSICELHELQYLNLSRIPIKELPLQLRKLVKLKFLVSYSVKRIPAGLIANLPELQVLDLGCALNDYGFQDWELEDGPSFTELDGLKKLHEVRITIKTDVAFEKFLCNRKLQMVCTGLRFNSSNASTSSSSSRTELNLSNFKNLKDLELISGFSEVEELVLYGSTTDVLNESTTDRRLLSNLETLSLDCFPKLITIRWTATEPRDLLGSHFQSLHYISIARCDALKDLTWLAYVENLKELSVQACNGLETIIEGDQMLNTGGLKTLIMFRLPKLKSICRGRHALAFPSIDTISIRECPELKKLPLGSCSNVANTLKLIAGEPDWWNKGY